MTQTDVALFGRATTQAVVVLDVEPGGEEWWRRW
jgi:hypothetical protein